MNKKTLGAVIIIILIIVIGGILLYQNQQSSELKTQTVKIGMISPLTGGAASWGIQHQRAVRMAIDEINAQGNIQFEVVYEDSQCDGAEAVNAVNKLINVDGVKIILGGTCSGETLAAKSIFEDNKVIDFSWGSSPEITKDSAYIFRNSPSDDDAGKQLAAKIFKDYKELGLLYDNADFSKDLSVVLKAEYERLGGKILVEEITTPDTKDYKVSLTKIKAANPPAIMFLGGNPNNIGLMAKQIREIGIDVQLYSAYIGPSIVEAAGLANIKGTIYVDSPKLANSNKIASDFLQKYQTLYNEKPQGSEFYAGAAYDTVYIFDQVLKQCNADDTNCIREKLHNIKFSGALGSYGFDQAGNVVGVNYEINVVE